MFRIKEYVGPGLYIIWPLLFATIEGALKEIEVVAKRHGPVNAVVVNVK